MKKRIAMLLLGTALTVSALTGCQNTGAQSQSSTDAAPDLASVNAAGSSAKDADLSSASPDSRSLSFDASADASLNSAADASGSSASQTAAASASAISEDKAKSIALKQAGVKESDTIGLTVKRDFDDGFQLYEVDIYTPDADYEYEINMADGTILKQDMEYVSKASSIQSQTSVTPDAAKKAVLKKVSGAADKHLRMKLDLDDGRYTYEGEIIYNNMSYDFEMDAQNGAIYEWEQKSLQY